LHRAPARRNDDVMTIRARKKPTTTKRPGTRSALSDRRLRVSRTGLHDQATARLRTLIVRCDLAPGEVLSEAALSEALGISRTPLREALKLLAAEGLVELRMNRSSRVALLGQAEVEELFEAVAGIERIAAELAAERMTERDIRRLEQLQKRIERHHERGELRAYFDLNQQIHGFIVAAARNNTITATHKKLLARVERARFFALSAQGRWDESVDEHRRILAALEAHDGETAGRALEHHVRKTGLAVKKLIRERADPQ
jgi:DNA-binding GntR family transcriptional regulator